MAVVVVVVGWLVGFYCVNQVKYITFDKSIRLLV